MEAGFFSFRSGSAYPNVGTRWVYAFRICVAQRHSEFMDRRTSRTIHDLGAVFARSIPLYFSVVPCSLRCGHENPGRKIQSE